MPLILKNSIYRWIDISWKAYNIGSFGPWSKLNDKQYAECCARTGGKTLEDELADWGEIAKKHRADNHKSYAYFVENKKK